MKELTTKQKLQLYNDYSHCISAVDMIQSAVEKGYIVSFERNRKDDISIYVENENHRMCYDIDKFEFEYGEWWYELLLLTDTITETEEE